MSAATETKPFHVLVSSAPELCEAHYEPICRLLESYAQDGIYVELNGVSCMILRFEPAETLGRSEIFVEEYQEFPPDTSPKWRRFFLEDVRTFHVY